MPKALKVLGAEEYALALETYGKLNSVVAVARKLGIPKSRANRLIQQGLPALNLPPIKATLEEKIVTQTAIFKELGSITDKNFYLGAYLKIREKIVQNLTDPIKYPPVSVKEIETIDRLFDLREKIREEEKVTADYLMLPFDTMTSKDIRDLACGKRKPKS